MEQAMETDGSAMLQMYEVMATIRKTEERVRSMVMTGQVQLSFFSPLGEEAICAGMGAALRADDYMVTTYRGIGDQIAKGVPLTELLAEYFGRTTGTCGGKGGPMHIAHPASGLMVSTGIVGSGIPIANGLAIASQLRAESRVTVCSFGDGATNIGAFHEALNLAQLWHLPVIFLCHNNLWAEHTYVSDHQVNAQVVDRAVAYAMPAIRIDGRDPVLVRDIVRQAAERARGGGGPTLIEAVAPRLGGHVVGDPMSYQPKGWLEDASKDDPVPAFRRRLIEEGSATDADLDDVDSRVAGAIDAAVEFAKSSEYPAIENLSTNVYAGSAA